MTIRNNGGIFGRNPTFNNVGMTGSLTGISNLTISGNLIVDSGKGIDFSATAGTGTSELLNDYEEGTWTPVDASGASLSITVASATYVKIGRIVHCSFNITYPTTSSSLGVKISGLPFASANQHTSGYAHGYTDSNTAPTFLVLNNSAVMDGLNYNFSSSITNLQFSGKTTKGLVTYHV